MMTHVVLLLLIAENIATNCVCPRDCPGIIYQSDTTEMSWPVSHKPTPDFYWRPLLMHIIIIVHSLISFLSTLGTQYSVCVCVVNRYCSCHRLIFECV